MIRALLLSVAGSTNFIVYTELLRHWFGVAS